MKNLILIHILLTSLNVFARDGVYIAAGAVPIYGSGDKEETSSLLGTGISASGGFRLSHMAFEMGLKRLTVTNKELGNDKYETEVKNSTFYGGGRLFFDHIFSLKAGIASHNIEMDIYKGPNHLKNKENDGEYIALYGGMGILTPLHKYSDLYFESTLYPISDIGMYFIDIEVGVRLYL